MSLRDDLVARFPKLDELHGDIYVVGGAVRDLLLGLNPADVDIAANQPQAVAERIGPRLIRLGTEEHLSAWRVIEGGHTYDVAALEGGEIDPDLARRDFTVNAMAVRLGDGAFLDPHHGKADLELRVVRMIDPTNFDDDPLRCLKAIRMAVRFDFEIDGPTLNAIRRRAPLVRRVAPERVSYEMDIIFSAGRFRRALELLRATGLDEALFGAPITKSFAADDVSPAGAMALLVSDPRAYSKRWRWSSDLLRHTTALQSLLAGSGDLRVSLYEAGEEIARQFPAVLRAVGRDDSVAMPDFAIRPLLDGEEIASLSGLRPGPELGRLKRQILEGQIRGEIENREAAVRFIEASRPPRQK
jgi:tRNA nucleotidyltransferase/poly(A) polymerase